MQWNCFVWGYGVMKHLLDFEEFIKKGIVKKTSEISRADFLVKESKRKFNSLVQIIEKIGITDLNAHEIIEYCYDIIIYLLRAKLLKQGYSSSGEGSHEAEVAFMRTLGFGEKDVSFMNQLRYFRNGIKYYGKTFDKEYAEQVFSFLEKIQSLLIKKIEDK